MATAEFQATAGTLRASASSSNLIGATGADATTADTDAGTVVTDLTTALAAFDTAAADAIAVTGDTYSNTTHQFTFGGSTGLTHAQWATFGALLNTAVNDVVTAATDAATAKTATAATVTAAGAIDSGADVTVRVGSLAHVSSIDILVNCLREIERVARGNGAFARGQPNPRSP